MFCYQKGISIEEIKEALEMPNFHYITSLIKNWINGFKITVKAFSSCEFPECKQLSFTFSCKAISFTSH